MLKILLILVSFLCGAAKIETSEIKFKAIANPGFLEIEGKGAKAIDSTIIVNGDDVTGSVKVLLKEIVTGMDLRDKHLHGKYLDTEKYPVASLDFKGKNGKFEGLLTVKDDTVKVYGSYVLGPEFKAQMQIDLKSFPSIGIPNWLGVTVADKVDIFVKGKVI